LDSPIQQAEIAADMRSAADLRGVDSYGEVRPIGYGRPWEQTQVIRCEVKSGLTQSETLTYFILFQETLLFQNVQKYFTKMFVICLRVANAGKHLS
jgi:hypothetical protein